jgi:two-component system, chemotaxis family, sensor kinase CheA
MDEMIKDFLGEVGESLADLDVQVVELETNPNSPELIDNIFRVMHTIKGTSGFLGLDRLGQLTHRAENLVDLYRQGATVTSDGVTLILQTLDAVKDLIDEIYKNEGKEPAGDDAILHDLLDDMATKIQRKQELEASGHEVAPEELLPQATAEEPAGKDNRTPEKSDAETSATKEALPAKPRNDPASQTVRTSVSQLNHLMDTVGELVLVRNRIQQVSRDPQQGDLNEAVRSLSHIVTELQEGVMKTRMQPIEATFNAYTRTVRDLAKSLNKKIELYLEGEDTEVDRQVLELIKDPLTHMIRNCADHALEGPDERLALGKPEVGKIRLRAMHEGGHIIIQIQDDGKGISVDRVSRKALEKGLVTTEQLATMTPNRIRSLIFHAGFSTADNVTTISGRGVGMDVVRNNIEKIGGTIAVESQEGKGTTFTIKIPLTLAILSTFICGVGDERFAIPQMAVQEIVSTRHENNAYSIDHVKDTPLLRLRGTLYPLIDLSEICGLPKKTGDTILVCTIGAESFGIVVDEVYDVQEIVVKPLSKALRDTRIYSGNTILGDGSAIMIIDPVALFSAFGVPSNVADRSQLDPTDDEVAKDIVKMVVFRAGGDTPKAVHLSIVSRIEKVDTQEIYKGHDGRFLLKYRDTLMPVLCPSGYDIDRSHSQQTIIVFTDENRALGLAVEKIERISDTPVMLDVTSEVEGIIGNAIIDGQATEIHDVSYYLDKGLGGWYRSRDQRVDTSNLSVLVVDDSQFFRNVLQSSVASRGYEVETAMNGDEAISKMRGRKFDVLVSDIEMPGMNGLDLIAHIRKKGPLQDISAVAISSHETDEDKRRGYDAGFDEYLTKTDRDSIFEFLNAALEKKMGKFAQ